MRRHANRIETELIARKAQQLTGQSPPTSRSYVNNIHAKQRSRQKALQFRKLPNKKRHEPSRKKTRNTTNDQDL